MKYTISAGYISGPKAGEPLPRNRSDLGWSRDLDRAIARAQKMSRHIRTDVPVFVHDGERVLAATGSNSGPGGVFTRELIRT
jgi:hypothetical protein